MTGSDCHTEIYFIADSVGIRLTSITLQYHYAGILFFFVTNGHWVKILRKQAKAMVQLM
jgi:hypothetical protein